MSKKEKYLFYTTRYLTHQESLKFEKDLYVSARKKILEIQAKGMSWVDAQFLEKAVDILCECRSALSYSYVFGFYHGKNNQKEIFEANQKDLETATEVLSEYLERDMSEADASDIKEKVLNKSIYCDQRRKNLLAHVHEGFKKKWWNDQFEGTTDEKKQKSKSAWNFFVN